MPEHAGALGEGDAGGHHVVEDRHVRGQRDARAQSEGAAHVAAAGDRIQFGLRRGAAPAQQHVVAQRDTEVACQRLREFERLVVAALAQADAMQWYRQ